jgi:predicted transposase/invertase (TIGR01784 family)
MDKIIKAHDKFFAKIFSDTENIKSFLKIALPAGVLKVLDFSKIEFDLRSYITGEIKGFSSDMVVKLKMFRGNKKKIDTDIYFLFEHKSYRDKKIFMQLLKYMYLMWQKDMAAGKPLRVIVPIVFYHDKYKWKMPQSFNDQFDVNEDVKKYLLNYKYILFDTNSWNLEDQRNEKLRDNVNLMAYLFLMKSAFQKGLDTVKTLVDFWIQKGLEDDMDLINASLNYIVSIKNITPERLIKILEESKIQGGEIMQSLAQKWVEQGIEQGFEEGIEKGIKKGIEEGMERGIEEGMERGIEKGIEEGMEKGVKKGKIQIAKELINNGIDIDIIARSTGFSRQEIKKLTEKPH